jgi:PIN domain nuclease of toxin-antitoxin system
MVEENEDLPRDVQAIRDDYENIIYVSSESIKEFIHLMQENRITIKKEFRTLDVFNLIENTLGLHVKYVTKEHLQTFVKLNLIEGHTDPSDRLIIAQALTEKMPLISSDKKFPKYRKMGLDLIVSY